MSREPLQSRTLAGRPGRVAAVVGASVVCLLSVTGALGLSLVGGSTGTTNEQALGTTPGGLPEGAAVIDTSQSTPHVQPPAETPDTSQTGGRSTPTRTAVTALPADSGQGRRVVFGVAAQRVWLVTADGAVARTYPVSGSKYDNLELGTYHVYSRSLTATAYNSNELLRYMVRFAVGHTSAPIGFHSIPIMPGGGLAETRSGLGKPASDGCVRQWITDAKALWDFAPVGTTVVVHA